MKDIIRMNQLAGLITEGQARKMMRVLNENEEENDIISFLETHIEDVKKYLKKRFPYPEDLKMIKKIEGFDYDGSDIDVTPYGDGVEMGVSFNWAGSPSLEGEEDDPEVIKIGGKKIGVSIYNI